MTTRESADRSDADVSKPLRAVWTQERPGLQQVESVGLKALWRSPSRARCRRPTLRLACQRMTAVDSPRNGLEPLLSVKEVADCLGISESGVYRLCRAGDLAGVKVGGRTLFEPQEVRQFIEASRRQVPDRGPSSSTEETEEA